ncbi:MAG: 2-polyprenyl-3-methyl-6-methoxy-1,4-benzoquinone monooxygenase [Burkholderiaceae bacterium]
MFNLDAVIIIFDKALRSATGITPVTRPSPATTVTEVDMTQTQRRQSAGLMRVNHVGEVCAQALYQSQSRIAHNPEIAAQFRRAGREEQDHLGWTGERLGELGTRPSMLNPLWYAASYGLGTVAARMGDATSLGFMVETERQVEAHLASHLERLPAEDRKSRAIVEQMRLDEAAHGQHASSLGARELPAPVKSMMRAMSRVMTGLSYYI